MTTINNYTRGSSGTITNNGNSVGYTIGSQGSATTDCANQEQLFENETLEVTFASTINSGLIVYFDAMETYENIKFYVNGQEGKLNEMMSDGRVTVTGDIGDPNKWEISGTHDNGASGTITFNFAVDSIRFEK